jgi:Inner membrane protein YgaP-like, transmembrane domain
MLIEVSAMSRIRGNTIPLENIGLVDRMVRFFGGVALMAYGVLKIVLTGHDVVSAAAILLAVYPLMTTCMGWDPFYQLFRTRSCSLEGGRNQCGTFPYELDSALGHDPRPDEGYEYDHSLAGSHHEHHEASREAKWKAAA